MSRYEHIFFDLDGTILDSTDMIVQSLQIALQTHLGKVPEREHLVSGIGTPLYDQLAHHAALVGMDHPSIVEDMVRCYLDDNLKRHDGEMKIFPDAKHVIKELHNQGQTLAIVTSKPVGTAERGLNLFGLRPYFQLVIGCDSVTHHKPHPEPVLAAMRTLGSTPDRTLFIGDSTHDIVSGNRAGVSTAGVLWGPYKETALREVEPTFICAKFTDILSLIRA